MGDGVAPGKARSGTLTPQQGFWCALGAFLIWGFLPLYFIPLTHVHPVELVAQRIVWAVPFALGIMLIQGRLREIPPLFRDLRLVLMMMFTATLIAGNWGVYLYAIAVNQPSQAALGYFITPLMNVLFGALLLGERFTKLQLTALVVAAAGVVLRIAVSGEVPTMGLVMATTFALYGYFRKTVDVGPVQGFVMEVLLLAPFALAFLIYLEWTGAGHFGDGIGATLLLAGTGLLTAVPLILYAYGAKALKFATLGLMQYIGPSLIFVLSFTVFGEQLTWFAGLSFALIWFALALYTLSFLRPVGGRGAP